MTDVIATVTAIATTAAANECELERASGWVSCQFKGEMGGRGIRG